MKKITLHEIYEISKKKDVYATMNFSGLMITATVKREFIKELIDREGGEAEIYINEQDRIVIISYI